MSDNSNKAKILFQEPISMRGESTWVNLDEPDFTYKKYGVYRVVLAKSIEEGENILDNIFSPLLERSKEEAIVQGYFKPTQRNNEIKMATQPYKYEINRDGEETGRMIFTFSAAAGGVDKQRKIWERTIPMYDSRRDFIINRPNIGAGSDIVVSGVIRSYYSSLGLGLSLKLAGVQLLKLEEYKGPSGEALGFKIEDGYVASTSEDITPTMGDHAANESIDRDLDFD